jgi:hypothetical protein
LYCDDEVESDAAESSAQDVPFQVSRRFPCVPAPTATQNSADTHETPFRVLYCDDEVESDPAESSAQDVPFQVRRRFWVAVPV